MRRNFTKTPSILQRSHPLLKSGLTFFASCLDQAEVSMLPSSALESELLSNLLSTPWRQAWRQISLSGFSISADTSHLTPSQLCCSELATTVGNKNRHTGRQVSQAMSQLKACCHGSCVPLPTFNFPRGPRNGRRAETKLLLLHAWQQENQWPSGNKSLVNSHFQPGCPADRKSRHLSSYCPQTAGQRGLPKAQQPQY